MGSSDAVSTATENSIKAIVGSSHVTRIQGSTRYETCYKIYQAGQNQWSRTLILATGSAAPDAMSAAPYSYKAKAPVFLVQGGTTLQSGMQTAISSGAFDHVVILGAPEVISTDLETWVKSQVGASNVIRLYGNDRYQTSSKVAEWTSGNMPSAAFQPTDPLDYRYPAVANGGTSHFPDALSGGAFSGHNGSVLLLTQDDSTTNNYTVQNNIIPHKDEIHIGYVLGAAEVLSDDFKSHLNVSTQ